MSERKDKKPSKKPAKTKAELLELAVKERAELRIAIPFDEVVDLLDVENSNIDLDLVGIEIDYDDFMFGYEKNFKDELVEKTKRTSKIIVFKAVDFIEVEVPSVTKKIRTLKL
ncbi:MAG: hypothetical protein ACTSW7_00905 [Candidatus Thorarchaeota archaeon]|nr:hypothetical protein [Thermoplasmatales archaeon]